MENIASTVVHQALNDMKSLPRLGRAVKLLKRPLPRDSTSGRPNYMCEFYKLVPESDSSSPAEFLKKQLSAYADESGPANRCLTVVGASGTGKTRMIYELGRADSIMCPIRTIMKDERKATHMKRLYNCLELAMGGLKEKGRNVQQCTEEWQVYKQNISGITHLFLLASLTWLLLVAQQLRKLDEKSVAEASRQCEVDKPTIYKQILMQSQRNGRAEHCIADLFTLALRKWVNDQPDNDNIPDNIPRVDPESIRQETCSTLKDIRETVDEPFADGKSLPFLFFLDEAQVLLKKKNVLKKDGSAGSVFHLFNHCIREILDHQTDQMGNHQTGPIGYLMSGTSSGIIADTVKKESPLKGAVTVCNFGQVFDAQQVKNFFQCYFQEYVVKYLEENGYVERLVGRPTYTTRFVEYFTSIFTDKKVKDGEEKVPDDELKRIADFVLILRKSKVKDLVRTNWYRTDKISTGERHHDLVLALYGALRLGYTYDEFLRARNKNVGELVESSLLNSIKTVDVTRVQYPTQEDFISQVNEKEESFLRECLLEVGDEICMESCHQPQDPALALIQSETTGVNVAAEAKGYAAEEALAWVFLRQYHRRQKCAEPCLLGELFENFLPKHFEMPSSLNDLRCSFADGAIPITNSYRIKESILEVLLDSNGTIRKVLIVKTPTNAGTADVIFPVFDADGEFRFLVLIQIKNRKTKSFATALLRLDIWQWGPRNGDHIEFLRRNDIFQNVIRVPCCSRDYSKKLCSSVNTQWNSVPGSDKYKVVLLRLNENNLGIDSKTRHVKGQMAPPRHTRFHKVCRQTYPVDLESSAAGTDTQRMSANGNRRRTCRSDSQPSATATTSDARSKRPKLGAS